MDENFQKNYSLCGIVFELDPNESQRASLAKSVGSSRYVYNWGLSESQRDYERLGKRPSLGELKRRLLQLKKTEAPWLYEVSAHISQSALKDLKDSYEKFFNGLKGEGPKAGFPKFKRKGERDSARLYEVDFDGDRHLKLPRIGRVRLKETRADRGFEGRILSATIRRRADRWFISLCVEQERDPVAPRFPRIPSDVVGVDLGLKSLAIVHDGTSTRFVDPEQALRRNLRKLARLHRQLSRKQKGSANHQQAKINLARLYYRISCLRKNQLHQLSSSLAKHKAVIVIEDLNVAGMKRNKHLALSISDAGWAEFRRQLTYKSDWYGATLVIADRFYPSSKTCSNCESKNHALTLRDRAFNCSACGLSIDRDENAAINLRKLGLQALATKLPEGLREVTPVERKALAPFISSFGVKPTSKSRQRGRKQEAKEDRSIERSSSQRRMETLAGSAMTSGTELCR